MICDMQVCSDDIEFDQQIFTGIHNKRSTTLFVPHVWRGKASVI